MKFTLNTIMVLWALMLLATVSVGSINLEALQELHRREALGRRAVMAYPIIPAPDPMEIISPETIIGTGYSLTTISAVTTLSGDEPSGPITIVSTVTDTECPESTTLTKTLVTVTKCPGSAGCTGLVPGAQTTSASVAEEFTTRIVTQTTCPHVGPCTTKLTTLVTSAGNPGTGTAVVPIPTGGHYSNTTEIVVTASPANNPGGSHSKSPTGPTTVATSTPKFNGAQRQQAIVNQLIVVAVFMVLLFEIM
ncbi:hypothetical protein N7481_004365 [Penicillium waksmanii]|uniref:uncharacterized protein n=1 Tax=Penicillium waksmanii TaxID=69791 RepID=UPI002547F5F8|nr:uncharacterized protein N7481_004365 [Penicillium waksmanii]KAJ5989155.1 hypothetical protein N7481_004365 [Penicillium waksmanii]